MKKILIISLSILALGAVSCKKCQTCTTNVTQIVGGINVNVSADSQEYCGNEYDDAPAETTVQQNVGGIVQTVSITCTDN
jgi:hypothetical protein